MKCTDASAYVRITKKGVRDSEGLGPGIGFAGEPIPLDYWVEGQLLHPITPGGGVKMLRYVRNGIAQLGFFGTSEVVRVLADADGRTATFLTENSKYIVDLLKKPDYLGDFTPVPPSDGPRAA